MKWDYIIVGQGLAGSILSYTMWKRKLKVLVIDDPKMPKASQVAAGIYNPFTGRNLVKTWLLDTLFPFLEEFYAGMEKELETSLLHHMPMFRPFVSLKEQNQWGAKEADPDFNSYIDCLIPEKEAYPQVHSPFGGLMLKGCGYVNTGRLIESVREFLLGHDCLMEKKFMYDQMELSKHSVSYQGETAKKIIFCEGPNLCSNPYFKWLPLRLVKGETLLIKVSQNLPFILNRGVFVLPVSEDSCLVGATFNHQQVSWEVTEQARQELELKMQQLISWPYEVVEQRAGIRPATKDRRPFIGIHPRHEPLGVFNGLGTKGVSLAPYFASRFCDYLEQGRALIDEVSINRYF